MADRDHVQKTQTELSSEIFPGGQSECHRNTNMVRLIIQLLMLVVQRKTKRRWAYSNMVSMVRFHLMTYIDLFKFHENPNKQYKELSTKPPDKQLSLF